MLRPYNIQNNDSGEYRFVTDNGVHYVAMFLEVAFPSSGRVFSFLFDIEDGKEKAVYDNRIEETIVTIMNDFWKNDSNVVFLVCESDRRKPGARMRLFNRWYNKWNVDGLIKKIDRVSDINGLNIGLYASLMYHKDNALSGLYENDFNEMLECLNR